ADAGADEGKCPGTPGCPSPLPRIAAPPHVDLAVIRLDAAGRAVEAADVQLDPGSPTGRVVALDRSLATTGVRFRRWSPARREAGAAAGPFTADDDLVPRRHPAGRDFMAPYPASVFKLLVAFHLARRVDEGAVSLRTRVAAGPEPGAEVRPIGDWLEAMVTESDNQATKALLWYLHAHGDVEKLNRRFAALGLATLRLDGTSPADGGRWAPGEIHATAMDVARLLWLVAGGPGVRWRAPSGRLVTAAVLGAPGRALLRRLLAEQGFHELLSSGLLCGSAPAGIPAPVPERFLDAAGAATVLGVPYGRDVRPCNEAAQVRFLHKTGLTWNYAADAGLVEPLPGKPWRRYVVVLLSSAGTRYLDPERASAPRHPCGAEQVCATRKLSAIGAAVDAAMLARAGAAPRARPGRRP
ncbi:MAG TPA: serine hydrolase, partial [Anaeromyxobacteraceae bacterium]|nr:serine hydrolase [Anaeromyxobacteraceae bacterium]